VRDPARDGAPGEPPLPVPWRPPPGVGRDLRAKGWAPLPLLVTWWVLLFLAAIGVERATIVVAPRDGYADAEPAYLEQAFPGSPVRVAVLDGPRMRLSASEIRSRAAAGRSVRYLVPDAVAAYIGDHSLYQDPRRTHRT